MIDDGDLEDTSTMNNDYEDKDEREKENEFLLVDEKIEFLTKIDMRSEYFDPSIALKIGEPIVKVLQDVPPLPFFSSCKAYLNFDKLSNENESIDDDIGGTNSSSTSKRPNELDEKLEQRKQERKQCFSFASDNIEYKNPFVALNERNTGYKLLFDACSNKEKIKVVIRDIDGILGICEGYLISYDHHMNLFMRDVKETLKDPKEWVMISRGHGNKNENTPEWIRKPSLKHQGRYFYYNTKTKTSQWNSPPNVKFKMIQRPAENYTCRHLPQLLIRGDMVVLVSKPNVHI